MGAHSSHHEPLDRNRHGTSFRRAASMRQSKSKTNKLSPNGRMDRLRRSFRDSFRRRRGENSTSSDSSRPQQWQSDEMDVRSGTCFFHVKYLGCVEVFESRGMQVCEEALRKLSNRKKRPIKAVLYVSGDGLRVVEDDTKGLIVDQTIEKVSFCAPDRCHERGFSYICRDGTTRRWLCHGFLSLRESGERLSHAVGCAFAVCLERKQKRDRECNVTMNFDLSSATFTRTGSFKQPSLTDRLSNNVNSLPAAATSNTRTTLNTSNTISARTVININNNISTSCNRKENIPIRTTPKISTKAIERPHASASLLQRQGSFRGLSHLNHASPFKRQLSLRISDLPSNMERARSHRLEYAFKPSNETLTQLSLLKTLVNPIQEASPTHENNTNTTTVATVTANSSVSNASDQVSAMCQQLSQGLSLMSKNDDFLRSTSNQLDSMPQTLATGDLFAQNIDQSSSQHTKLQPTVSQSTAPSSTALFLTQQQSCADDSKIEQSLPHPENNVVTVNGDTKMMNNNTNNVNLNIRNDTTTNNSGVLSQTSNAAAVSSIEIISLTPPSTPPLQAGAQLPKPDQWLGKVAKLTLNVTSTEAETIPTASTTSTSASAIAPSTFTMHPQPYSSSTETVLQNTSIDEKPPSDPFNIDWALLAAKTTKAPSSSRNTNPFLSNSPRANLSNQPMKTFEVQM